MWNGAAAPTRARVEVIILCIWLRDDLADFRCGIAYVYNLAILVISGICLFCDPAGYIAATYAFFVSHAVGSAGAITNSSCFQASPASQVGLGSPDIIFEFSNRRWRTTAGFLQMELMSGMRLAVRPGLPSDGLHASQRVSVKLVQLVEPVADVAPNFRVWSNQPEQPDQMEVIWDYQVEGQLPTIRALRRRIRWSNLQ
ncbi:uncharacterized protein PSANT_07081 [Moesziomyces antarcticus]|uniref:Uncharacterized protein n=1 Tax=Pseudozyma antarctica TaxID=84753 RepID=A0A5C3FYH3_PSEA2|nr:uncharacterized protein PSANT_07081 [Moesziomyces antarcticus]